MKFRKRPVVVEAERVQLLLNLAAHSWKELPEWVRDAYHRGEILFGATDISVRTEHGLSTARRGDWLIRGTRGEVYPCEGETFTHIYELHQA